MKLSHLTAIVLLAACAGPWGGRAGADEADLFTRRIAPVLRERCVRCHNAKKARSGVDLTTRQGMTEGGDTGAAIVPGKADASLMVKQVSGPKPKMPREGQPLTRQQVADLRRWIDAGAAWPRGITLTEAAPAPKGQADWWSLRTLTRPPLPAVKDRAWVRTPIDTFILAGMEARGLKPSPAADRATLLRRVTFNLHGLPPTPAEIDAFVRDPDPRAYEKVIDRLLSSPRYGERWARHWLDVVHYGDTHGYDKDKRRDHAWPYRDYVIRAFNQDRPYARFIREQVAGDVLAPDDVDAVAATGFIAAGPWDFVGHVELRERTMEKAKTRLLDRDDMVANTISTFVSMTAHCARCHDHKFDPISQTDYYRLQAVFAGVERGNLPLPGRQRREAKDGLGKKQQASPVALRRLASQHLVYAVVPHAPRPIRRLHRGSVEQPREAVRPGALSAVAGLAAEFRLANTNDEGQRRVALADWLASPRNVLTWRSIVNRVWHYHFGRGLVDTPNDFGHNGGRPTHPEMLDWLAVEFRDGGQSFKRLHRLILLSSAYRQAVRHRTEAAAVDADNRYLWRMNRQRLDAESVRDAVLAVSGKLDPRMGGPGFALFRFKDDHSPVYDHTDPKANNDPLTWRRTVYRFTVRSVPNPFLECLDCADPNINTPVRGTTLTALQALALLNDPFMVKQARFFADRLRVMSADPGRRIEAGYRLAFGRPPTSEERAALVGYAARHGLANACRLLFNANEFVFID
jgi:hypothetical protein